MDTKSGSIVPNRSVERRLKRHVSGSVTNLPQDVDGDERFPRMTLDGAFVILNSDVIGYVTRACFCNLGLCDDSLQFACSACVINVVGRGPYTPSNQVEPVKRGRQTVVGTQWVSPFVSLRFSSLLFSSTRRRPSVCLSVCLGAPTSLCEREFSIRIANAEVPTRYGSV